MAVDLGGGAGAGLGGAVAARLVAHAERRKSAPTIRPSRTLCLGGMAQHTANCRPSTHSQTRRIGERDGARGPTAQINTRSTHRPVRELSLLALAQVLAMTLWFSATAVLPALSAAWSLSATGAAWRTGGGQRGFVA